MSAERERRFLLVFEEGEEIVGRLRRFALEQRVPAAEFSGVGSFGALHLERRGWIRPEGPPLRLRSLDGTLRFVDGKLCVEVDVAVTSPEGAALGGRMSAGYVGASLKLVFTEIADHAGRAAL